MLFRSSSREFNELRDLKKLSIGARNFSKRIFLTTLQAWSSRCKKWRNVSGNFRLWRISALFQWKTCCRVVAFRKLRSHHRVIGAPLVGRWLHNPRNFVYKNEQFFAAFLDGNQRNWICLSFCDSRAGRKFSSRYDQSSFCGHEICGNVLLRISLRLDLKKSFHYVYLEIRSNKLQSKKDFVRNYCSKVDALLSSH